MNIKKLDQSDEFTLSMDKTDICSLFEMIKSAGLQERRYWFNVRKQIEEIIK